MATGDHVEVNVGLLEFKEGGNTIWVQGFGGTVLRIKCTGRIVIDAACQNTVAHADIQVEGDINICLPQEVDQHGKDLAHE